MSLDKAIEHKKEFRKPFIGAKKVSKRCRCNGGCPYCTDNRLHQRKAKEETAEEEIEQDGFIPSQKDEGSDLT